MTTAKFLQVNTIFSYIDGTKGMLADHQLYSDLLHVMLVQDIREVFYLMQ